MLSMLVRPRQWSGPARAGLSAAQRQVPLLSRAASWWREILLLAVLYSAYEVSRGMGGINVQVALSNGREIMHIERIWHLDPEHVLNSALAHATWLAVAASYFYSVMHYVVTPTVLVWMYRKHRANYGPARTALAISTAVGLTGYLLLPTAPPRMLAHSGLHDTLADTSRYGWWAGEGSVPRGFGGLTNQFAAMPSLHVGWAIWCGVLIAVFARRRWVKALGVAYPITTTLVVMGTANHYFLDALAGGVVMALGALIAVSLSRTRRPAATRLHAERESLEDVLAGRSLTAARAAAVAARRGRQGPMRHLTCVGARDAGLCHTRD